MFCILPGQIENSANLCLLNFAIGVKYGVFVYVADGRGQRSVKFVKAVVFWFGERDKSE